MKTNSDPIKTKEVLLNLELLISRTVQPKAQTQLRLIKIWYRKWFADPQNEVLFGAWCYQWTNLLAQSAYSFPLPETIVQRKKNIEKPVLLLLINGEAHQFSEVKIAQVSKRFFHRGTIVLKSQTFSAFPETHAPEANLVVVTIKDKSDLLLHSTLVKLKRQAT